MAGVADVLWRWYQASPPALLALLTLLIGVGGKLAFNELRSLHGEVNRVEEKVDDVDEKVDRQEILIDQNSTELERARASRARNDRRIEQLLQQTAAAHGFDGRPGDDPDAAETTARSRSDPSDGGSHD
jgi:hypothetical protein